jgi:ribosomal protein L7/L12
MDIEDYEAALCLCDEVASEKGWVEAVKEYRRMTGNGLRESAFLAEQRWGKPKGSPQ